MQGSTNKYTAYRSCNVLRWCSFVQVDFCILISYNIGHTRPLFPTRQSCLVVLIFVMSPWEVISRDLVKQGDSDIFWIAGLMSGQSDMLMRPCKIDTLMVSATAYCIVKLLGAAQYWIWGCNEWWDIGRKQKFPCLLRVSRPFNWSQCQTHWHLCVVIFVHCGFKNLLFGINFPPPVEIPL